MVGMWWKGTLTFGSGNVAWFNSHGKTKWRFLSKVRIDFHMTYQSHVLASIPSIWAQFSCSTKDEWTVKAWYIYTIKCNDSQLRLMMKLCFCSQLGWNWGEYWEIRRRMISLICGMALQNNKTRKCKVSKEGYLDTLDSG